MTVQIILVTVLTGAVAGLLSLLLDNGLDVGEPDEKTVNFAGPIHIPTAVMGLIAVLVACFGYAMSYISGYWLGGVVAGAVAALFAAFIGSFFLSIINAILSALGFAVPWGDGV